MVSQLACPPTTACAVGALTSDEVQVIQGALDLANKTAEAVMTPLGKASPQAVGMPGQGLGLGPAILPSGAVEHAVGRRNGTAQACMCAAAQRSNLWAHTRLNHLHFCCHLCRC